MTINMFHRRDFLAAAAAPFYVQAIAGPRAMAQAPTAAHPGLIVRQQEPMNLEFPFSSLDSFVVPTERFYVRNHFAMPQLAAATWSLEVTGAAARPFRIGYEELRRLPSVTRTVTFECAGNNRVALVPRERGVLWGSGAVGNAEWTGVPLAALLERAGLQGTAVEVVLEGADEGAVNEDPRSPGPIHFARGLPIAKARQDVLLAYRMNGRDLTPAHGFPVRAVVPGWYGMASVKWLTRIVAVERPFQGFYQTLDYAYWERPAGLPTLRPIGEMDVKASIARPAAFEVIAAGQPYRVHGAAWTGEGDITQVEVSTDGGATWAAARLLGERVPHAWRLWESTWAAPVAGRHTLMARATDSRGRTQAMRRDLDRRNYMISHVLPVLVDAR
jgi:DMSO/TMAO reductase YedYZ molybdopterin-dependent catalytic subunit